MEKLSTLSKLYLAKELLFSSKSSSASLFTSGQSMGASVTDNKMLVAYSKLPWLRAAFGKVADGVAAAPWYLEAVSSKSGSGTKFKDVPSLANAGSFARDAIRTEISKASNIDKMYSHKMLDLLANPNPFITGHALIKLTQLHIELTGECLWWLEREGKVIKHIWPVPSTFIAERPNETNDYSEFSFTIQNDLKHVKLSEVVWFRDPDPSNPYIKTTGTAEPISDELAADEYAAKHVKAWFHNHARPDILVSGTGLEKEEAERAEERWLQKLRGYLKVGRPHFIGSEVKVTEIGKSFVDMQLVQLRKFQRDIVIQSLGLPPEILGILESSNRSTINSASYVFAKWVLSPRLDMIRQTMQTQLLPHFDKRLIIEYMSPVEEDREFRLEVMKAHPVSFTIDDWRAVVGDDPFPNGQGNVVVIPNASSLAEADKITEWESPYTQGISREGEGGKDE